MGYLEAQREAMVELLMTLARHESPSHEPGSQSPLFELFIRKLNQLGFRCRRIAGRQSGGQLLAVPRNYRRGEPKQLLLGHCDTVWPVGTLAEMPVEVRGRQLLGPGVYDMKAGLVQLLFALEALQALDLDPVVFPIVFINSDEEIGSPESAPQIHRLAKIVDRTLVVEPSLGPDGRLKTTRKGVGRFVVEVTGRAAHAGLDPERGVSAIKELAAVIQALFALNDAERGISVNVGIVAGGTRPNVIAATSRAEVDVRVLTQVDALRVEQSITGLQPTVPGIRLEIRGRINRPPLERTSRNRRLWQRAVAAADLLGIELDEAVAGGGSDGNWTSLHTATLDGLGAVGEGAHALNEQVVIDRMPERAALLAALLLEEPLGPDDSDGKQ